MKYYRSRLVNIKPGRDIITYRAEDEKSGDEASLTISTASLDTERDVELERECSVEELKSQDILDWFDIEDPKVKELKDYSVEDLCNEIRSRLGLINDDPKHESNYLEVAQGDALYFIQVSLDPLAEYKLQRENANKDNDYEGFEIDYPENPDQDRLTAVVDEALDYLSDCL